MNEINPAAKPLVELQPKHPYFIGIDSDGCAFDSMEIKHKECFCPNVIRYWGLQAVSKFARETYEFVNLYSKWRGVNRWPAFVRFLDFLRERPEVIARGKEIPQVPRVREFVESGLPLSDSGLAQYMTSHSDPELDLAKQWSASINRSVKDMVHDLPPFPLVRESLIRLQNEADLVVISGTPTEALMREWEEHNIEQYVRVIAGQEMGKKEQHLAWAAKGKYPDERILMVGDAPGDMKAARANGVLFYPIVAGHEEESWRRFYEEALDRFFEGSYSGAYESGLIDGFEKGLPEVPPWTV